MSLLRLLVLLKSSCVQKLTGDRPVAPVQVPGKNTMINLRKRQSVRIDWDLTG